ncbi:MAG: glutathione S-transferase C-terminal domain-containing protein, partial [Sneathiellales bacterium]|nr:glutathione S-transferase C-terminal domain-containing protein [Sneathiellales bacterium]
GKWSDQGRIITNGKFNREKSVFSDPFNLQPGNCSENGPRYWLIASKSCPWSHGATLIRSFLSLEKEIGLHIAHGPRLQGYAINGGKSWQVPGTDTVIEHLHELYSLADPHYTGRSTVPVLWDAAKKKILSNDSRMIIRSLNRLGQECGKGAYHLAPDHQLSEIDKMNDWLFRNLGNAVYRAGFAETQNTYNEAVETVFKALDRLEKKLARQRYLLGQSITETDWRLFATLVRFDTVYAILHRCCHKRLTDYPALWSYARELYSLPGVSDTVDFEEILRGSYLNDTSYNPHDILPTLPFADWRSPFDRERGR